MTPTVCFNPHISLDFGHGAHPRYASPLCLAPDFHSVFTLFPYLIPHVEDRYSDFTLYFLGFDHSGGAQSTAEKKDQRLNREGILELTHNHGTESDASFAGYASGNTDPGRGFGHIAISVPDIEAACSRLESLGVPFKKRLTDGKMKNIAFALDPDG